MKWVGRTVAPLALIVLLMGFLLLWGGADWVQRLLTYYVGSEVRFDALSLAWLGGGKWQAQFGNVCVASTEPVIPFVPIQAQKAVLTFQGLALEGVEMEGASFVLFRHRKGTQVVRNYQRLFPKRGRRRPLSVEISIKKANFYLLNEPAELEVQAQVEGAAGLLNVDSAWIGLDKAEVYVSQLGICYRGRAYEGLSEGRVRYAGLYRKESDSWESGFLQVHFPGLEGMYEGKILRWATLQGSMQVRVDSTLMRRWITLSPFVGAVMGRSLQASAVFEAERASFHAWGKGQWGQYEICGGLVDKRWGALEGALNNKPAYFLSAKSNDGESWKVKGHGWYQGYPWQAEGHLSYSSQDGEIVFQFGEIRGQGSGALTHAHGALYWRGLKASVAWDKSHGLEFRLDTTQWAEVRGFIQSHRSLWQGTRRIRLPWRVSIRQLELGQDWLLRGLELAPRGERLYGRGEVCYPPWDLCMGLEGSMDRAGGTGEVGGCSTDGTICGTAWWQGDSVAVSAAGLWRGAYYGQIMGWGALSQRRLWVDVGRLQSATGSYVEVRGTFSDSVADGIVQGEVSIPEILTWLPLKGVEIQEGYLTGKVCFQEGWQTLLSWDNSAEGWTRLSGVRGEFLKVGLPLSLSQVQVVFNPVSTRIEDLRAEVGEIRLSGAAVVQGTLGYLYEDWRSLQGRVNLSVERFRLLDVWRIRRGGTYIPRLLLPEKMNLHAEISAKEVDIVGFRFDRLSVVGALIEQTIRLDSLGAIYKGGRVTGWGVLDAMDTACYIAGWQARAEGLPLPALLTESGLNQVPAIRALGIQGAFSGALQAVIRFAPNLTWRENSTLLANGSISNGLFYTPSFFRWIRPFFISAYRDSMDFLAQVSELSIVDGYLQLPRSMVVTRIAAFTIEGTHLLSQDRFLYRMQGTRVLRKAQRYAYLDRLSPYLIERLAGSLWLIYIEKKDGRVRWIYPVKYLLQRLIVG